MRLALLLLPLLGRGLGGGCVLFAQNGVTVSNLAVDAGTVTFNVSWQTPMPVELWSDTVWVFVDYNNAGKMERLPLSPGATLTATSPGGKVIEESDNNKGVWVAGNARSAGSFSATVKLLTAIKDVGGACVYGSNYPPVGEYTSSDASEIKFTGTPQYDVVLLHESGSLVTTTTNSPFNVPASYTVQSFTDKTAAPGKLSCIPSTVYDLTASALSFCEGSAGVTFALSGTELGRIYQLYKDGTTAVAILPGTGSAASFSGMVNEAGIYTACAAALPEYCPAVMTGSLSVASVSSPDAPTLDGSSYYCTSGTITATPGDGGNGIRWDDGTTDVVRTVTASGIYHAITTTAEGCEGSAATISPTILAPAGLNQEGSCFCSVDGLTGSITSSSTVFCGYAAEKTFELVYFLGPTIMQTYAMAQAWVAGLGGDWRLPTSVEMAALYLVVGLRGEATGVDDHWFMGPNCDGGYVRPSGLVVCNSAGWGNVLAVR
jgi:hypothetical protein